MKVASGLFGAIALVSLFACCDSTSHNSIESSSKTSNESAAELVLKRLPDKSWSASLINHGEKSIDVVLPGDGSDRGWRTPIMTWIVTTDTEVVDQSSGGGCGNINALQADEVVHLRSGATVSLDRYGLSRPSLPSSGVVSVSLQYENVPKLEWEGLSLGVHDRQTMARVRTSTPLKIVSNVVQFEINEPSEDR